MPCVTREEARSGFRGSVVVPALAKVDAPVAATAMPTTKKAKATRLDPTNEKESMGKAALAPHISMAATRTTKTGGTLGLLGRMIDTTPLYCFTRRCTYMFLRHVFEQRHPTS